MPVDALFRTIREDDHFLGDATKIFGSAQKADEAFDGLKFVLAREPSTRGTQVPNIPGGKLYAAFVGSHGMPFAVVFYTFDRQMVYFHDVMPCEYDEANLYY